MNVVGALGDLQEGIAMNTWLQKAIYTNVEETLYIHLLSTFKEYLAVLEDFTK